MRCCPPRANASRCESSPRPSPFGILSHHPFRTLPYSCQTDSRALSNHAHTRPRRTVWLWDRKPDRYGR